MDEGSSEPDILEQGRGPRLPRLPSPGWRRSRGASVTTAVILAVGLAVGLAAGYAVGHGQGRTAAAPGEPPAPAGHGQGRTAAAPSEPPAPASQAPGSGASGTSAATASSASIGFLGLAQDLGTCSLQAGHNLELGIPVTNQSGETILL